jgi:hypothetical protein
MFFVIVAFSSESAIKPAKESGKADFVSGIPGEWPGKCLSDSLGYFVSHSQRDVFRTVIEKAEVPANLPK